MRRWLESRGYASRSLRRADEALELARRRADGRRALRLAHAGHDGLWLADQLRREHPDTAVIIATGVNDVRRGRGPAPGRHRLPDEAVRARPAVRSGGARRRVAPRGPRRAAVARTLEGEMRRGGAHLRGRSSLAADVDSDDELDVPAGDADGRPTAMPTRTPIASRRLSASSACALGLADGGSRRRSKAARSCTTSASWRCRKRCSASRRR